MYKQINVKINIQCRLAVNADLLMNDAKIIILKYRLPNAIFELVKSMDNFLN